MSVIFGNEAAEKKGDAKQANPPLSDNVRDVMLDTLVGVSGNRIGVESCAREVTVLSNPFLMVTTCSKDTYQASHVQGNENIQLLFPSIAERRQNSIEYQ